MHDVVDRTVRASLAIARFNRFMFEFRSAAALHPYVKRKKLVRCPPLSQRGSLMSLRRMVRAAQWLLAKEYLVTPRALSARSRLAEVTIKRLMEKYPDLSEVYGIVESPSSGSIFTPRIAA